MSDNMCRESTRSSKTWMTETEDGAIQAWGIYGMEGDVGRGLIISFFLGEGICPTEIRGSDG